MNLQSSEKLVWDQPKYKHKHSSVRWLRRRFILLQLREENMGAGFVIGVVGVLILSHAAYSTIQYRSLLKITEEVFSGPPINVVMELIAGLVLCMWAALTVPGKFLSILPQSDENRVVSLPANLDFMIFNHRGKAFPIGMDVKLK